MGPARARGSRLASWTIACTLLAAAGATACDVCAVYTATQLQEGRPGPYAGVAEQWSTFRTLTRDGEEIDNPGERLDSSITQVFAGWNFGPRAGVQANLPIISRVYRRRDGRHLEHGDETGVGDLAVLGHVLAFSRVSEDSVLRWTLLGGLELPTGNTRRLAEELDEADAAAARTSGVAAGRFGPQHTDPGSPGGGGGPPSGVHGHDLALGSGSVDGLVGSELFWSWKRAFVRAGMQYAIRTEGDFDYRYANEITWHGGPGAYVVLRHDWTLALAAVVSGETKGKDRQRGRRLDDTGITALYAGPGLLFTWGTSLGAELAVDLPAIQNTTSVQIVPDVRLRGGLTWRF
jgi:hypothetical protein